MKKLKVFLSGLCLAAVLVFSIAPTTVVHADTGGPQGGDKSTTKAPPPPSSNDLWAILMWLLMLLFGL